MKRYWKIISLSMLTVLILGGFYIHSALAADKGIRVLFEKVSGDEAEIENLEFYADLNMNDVYHYLQVSNKETVDVNQQSVFRSLNHSYSIPAYKKLVEEYKGFMRGKMFSPGRFYVDEKIVAYAGIHGEPARKSVFHIDVLNKTTDETNSFKVNLPEREVYRWTDVTEVQVFDGKLKVLVRGFLIDGTTEFKLYQFSIDDNKLEKSEVLLSTTPEENNWSDIRVIHNDNSLEKQKYILFYIETQNMQSVDEEFAKEINPEVAKRELLIYDIESDQIEELVFEQERLGQLDSASVYGGVLFMPTQMEGSFEINRYDLENKVWGETLSFQTGVQKKEYSSTPYLQVIKGKFYLISVEDNGHTLIIGDATTGKILYEGLLKLQVNGKNQSGHRLYINRIDILQ